MDIIFLDTSIYIAENYFVPSNRISMLKRLVSDGLVSVVSTEITNREVLRHFKGDLSGVTLLYLLGLLWKLSIYYA